MNRLNEIGLNWNIFDCNFIPGSLDPADLCTRYTPFNQLITSQPRFRGSEYTEEQARESIFDLEKIEQVEYLVDSKSINTTLTRKGKCWNLFPMVKPFFLFKNFTYCCLGNKIGYKLGFKKSRGLKWLKEALS